MIAYNTLITMVLVYIGLYAIMTVYMILSYYKLIREVYSDVKYLNRGE